MNARAAAPRVFEVLHAAPDEDEGRWLRDGVHRQLGDLLEGPGRQVLAPIRRKKRSEISARDRKIRLQMSALVFFNGTSAATSKKHDL